MGHLRNKTAIITGGSSGIGYAIAEAFAKQGINIVITGRDKNKLATAADRLSSINKEVLAIQGNVSNQLDVERTVNETIKKYHKVDILVNNAGIAKFSYLEDLNIVEWNEIIDINLKGLVLFSKAVLPFMKKERGGYIINISSALGKTIMAGSGAYSASKFGVMAITDTLIEEGVKYNIRATAICPGYVNTPAVVGSPVPPSEMIQPEDIANTVLYLLHMTEYAQIKEIVISRRERN